MSRLKQLNPGSYRNSQRISQEFENVVRYLNAAELGDKTVGELLGQLFNTDGEFEGPIEMRFDATNGLQYRIGTYTDSEEGWLSIASADALRGTAGTNLGAIYAPVFFGREDTLATNLQTNFDYSFDTDTEDVLVWVDGLLQREGATDDYELDENAQQVVFNSGLALNAVVTFAKVRTDAVNGYTRSDQTATTNQAVFAFVHTEDQVLMVYRNGVLQRAGGSYDYTTSPDQGTVTFTSPVANLDLISIITVENRVQTTVPGLLTEDEYTNGDGFLLGSLIEFEDDSIPQAKVNGLADLLLNRGRIYVQSTEPVDPSAGDGWLDTSDAPNVYKLWNGYDWVETSPNINIPDFDSAEALKLLRVNSGGSALEWTTVDLSSRVATADVDSPNGVCPLDSDSLVPVANLPDIFAQDTIYKEITSVSATSYTMKVVFSQTVRIDSIVLKTNTGTCNVEIEVDSVVVSAAPVSANSSLTATNLPVSITVNATSTPRRIGVKVSSLSGPPATLEVGLATSAITA